MTFPYSEAQYSSTPHRFFFSKIYMEMNQDFKAQKKKKQPTNLDSKDPSLSVYQENSSFGFYKTNSN